MDAGSAGIVASARSVQQKLDDLHSFLQPIVSAWEGESQAAYAAKKAQWDQAAADLFQILNQIGAAVGTAGQNYAATESANTKLWS